MKGSRAESELSSSHAGRSRVLVSQDHPGSPTASRPVHINVHHETYTSGETPKDVVELVPMEPIYRNASGFGEKVYTE